MPVNFDGQFFFRSNGRPIMFKEQSKNKKFWLTSKVTIFDLGEKAKIEHASKLHYLYSFWTELKKLDRFL